MDTDALLACVRELADRAETHPEGEGHQVLAERVRELDGLLTCGDPIPADWRF